MMKSPKSETETATPLKTASGPQASAKASTLQHESGDMIPLSYDVICGRGKVSQEHVGNKRFQLMIDMHKERYRNSPTKDEKTRISLLIVSTIRGCQPGGRFLKMDTATGKYYDIGEEKAREKVSQALREANNPARCRQSFLEPKRKREPKEKQDKGCDEVVAKLLITQHSLYRDILRDFNLDDCANDDHDDTSEEEDDWEDDYDCDFEKPPTKRQRPTGSPSADGSPERSDFA